MSERGFMTNRAIDAAARRAEENREAMSEQNDYAKRLAEIGEAVDGSIPLSPCDGTFLLAQIRAASTALAALGIPDDGRPLAERIGALKERHEEMLAAEYERGHAEGADIAREAADADARCARGEHRRAGESMPHAGADCGVDFGDLGTEDEPQAGSLGLSFDEALERYAAPEMRALVTTCRRLLSLRVDLRDETACAEITPEQANAYLRGKGWTLAVQRTAWSTWTLDGREAWVPLGARFPRYGRDVANMINLVADVEKRSPLAVWAEMKTASP